MFYKESNKIAPLGFVVLLTIIIAYAYFAGFLYSIISWYNPSVYLSFLIPVITAAILATILKKLIPITHNRSRNSQLIVAILGGVLLGYFSWASYLAQLMNEMQSDGILSFTQYNSNLMWVSNSFSFEILSIIKEEGVVEIAGVALKGGLLLIVWFVETILLIGIPTVIIFGSTSNPYSEKLGKVYRNYQLTRKFDFIDNPAETTLQELSKSPIDYLSTLEHGNGAKYSKMNLHYEDQEAKAYLSIVGYTLNDKDDYDEDDILINFEINSANAKLILDSNKTLK